MHDDTRTPQPTRAQNMFLPAVLAGATIAALAITSAVSAYAGRPAPTPAPALTSALTSAAAPELSPALMATRAALDKYKDPMAAVRDGYFSTVACMEFRGGVASGGASGYAANSAHGAGHDASHDAGHEHMTYAAGAMGVHFLNTANIGPTLDSLKPQVLLYEPVGDKLQLVGAEWFAPVAVAKTPPTIFGQTLQGPMEGHAPIMPAGLRHWDLHVWLWKDNPAGVFVPTNARVKCPASGYSYVLPQDDEPLKTARP